MQAGVPALRQRHRHVAPNATLQQDTQILAGVVGGRIGGLTGNTCNRRRDVDQAHLLANDARLQAGSRHNNGTRSVASYRKKP